MKADVRGKGQTLKLLEASAARVRERSTPTAGLVVVHGIAPAISLPGRLAVVVNTGGIRVDAGKVFELAPTEIVVLVGWTLPIPTRGNECCIVNAGQR